MLEPSLVAALDGGDFDLILTSGQRLAREIGVHHARCQLDAGHAAWTATDTLPWTAYMRRLYTAAAYMGDNCPPLERQLLNAAQARALWRDIVTLQLRDSADDMLGTDALVGEVMQAFALLCRFRIDRDALRAAAVDDDSKFLASCIDRLVARLDQHNWLLEEQLPDLFAAHASALANLLPRQVLLAGFEQLTPDQAHFVDVFSGTRFVRAVANASVDNISAVQRFAAHRDELIAAGRWARQAVDDDAERRLGVVVPGLAAAADDVRRWFAEGFTPGGQCDDRHGETFGFELSFGQPLADYPAVASALALLQLAVDAPRFAALSRLLRCAVLNDAEDATAVALELQLRELPDRRWTLDSLVALIDRMDAIAPAWLTAARDLQREAAAPRRPSEWAARIEIGLGSAGWLTGVETDSEVFQLRNAFHALLNALASLDRVVGETALATMLAALRERAQATIYQPQGASTGVLICGPLETPGLRFDALWIAGLDGERWPPAGRGSSLLPRRLQRDHQLPDATPEQTRAFWQQQFAMLSAAADDVVCSFAYLEGDSERLPAPVLDGVLLRLGSREPAVALGVAGLAGQAMTHVSIDALAAFDTARRLHGGYSTLQALNSDPFSAAVAGRWRCRALEEPGVGINGAQRGQLLHQALQNTFGELDDRDAIARADANALRNVVARAVADAMRPWFVAADEVLTALLRMEERRCRMLVDRFIDAELERPAFTVVAREMARELSLDGLRMNLRIDRIDRVGGAVLIIDYKTGKTVARVTEESLPDKHFQLLLYALTEREALAGLAIAKIGFDDKPMYALIDADSGALPKGRNVVPVDNIDDRRQAWRQIAGALAARFVAGDARINANLSREDRMPTALLSRIAAERHHAG